MTWTNNNLPLQVNEALLKRIEKMNATFNLPISDLPRNPDPLSICKFYKSIFGEVREVLGTFTSELEESEELVEALLSLEEQLIEQGEEADLSTFQLPSSTVVDLVALSDVLGDLIVYILSEACKLGIPIIPVLHAIMDSQESKLVDGKPLFSKDGSKFIKGPNDQPPEVTIYNLLYGDQ